MANQVAIVEHLVMLISKRSSPAAHGDPEALLTEVRASGLFDRWAQRDTGVAEGPRLALVAELAALNGRNPAAARLAWSQCMLIEALWRSPNVAVREHVLPRLLDGSLAGAVSWSTDRDLGMPPHPVRAVALDRGWHLHGRLEQVLNLQWMGFVVLCPVWFDGWPGQTARLGWSLLRSEEDGLQVVLEAQRPMDRQTASGSLKLTAVYFREDELLADDASALTLHLHMLDRALRPALWSLQHE